MSKQSTNRWIEKRRRIQEDAEALAISHNKSLPTNLKSMAQERKVREIDFRPLIVDGGMSLLDDGFLITVHCEEGEEQKFRDAFDADPTGRSLPRRVRFTIAHEIGHTFFFDLRTNQPKETEDHTDRRTLPSIEDACNLAARQLLLPEFFLVNQYSQGYGQADLRNPEVLRDLAERAAMSPPALVLRFESLLRFTMPDGMLLCVQQTNEGFLIQHIVRHAGYKDVFLDAVKGTPVTTIVQDKKFVLLGGQELESSRRLRVGGSAKNYVISAEDVGKTNRASYFMTVRRSPVDQIPTEHLT